MSGTFGIFKVKNVSGEDLVLAEIAGATLHNNEELDFLDQDLPVHYMEYDAIKRASTMTTTQLHQQLLDGDLVVTEDLPGSLSMGMPVE